MKVKRLQIPISSWKKVLSFKKEQFFFMLSDYHLRPELHNTR